MWNVDWQHLKHIWIICIKVIKSSTYKTTGGWAYVGLSVYGAWATAVTQQYSEQLWHVEFSTLILLIHFPKFVSHTAVVPHAVLLDVTTHTLFQVAHDVPLGVATHDTAPGSTCCSTWCRHILYYSRLHMLFHLMSPLIILLQATHADPLDVAAHDTDPGSACWSIWFRTHIILPQAPNAVLLGVTLTWYCSRLHMLFHLMSPLITLLQASHDVPHLDDIAPPSVWPHAAPHLLKSWILSSQCTPFFLDDTFH